MRVGLIDLVHAEVAEEDLVAWVVDACDGSGHVEVVLGHLADHQVVGIVTGHRGHDRGAVGAGLSEMGTLTAIAVDDDGAQLVADVLGTARILLHEDQLVALGKELLGQVEADTASPYDDHEHVSGLLSVWLCWTRSAASARPESSRSAARPA